METTNGRDVGTYLPPPCFIGLVKEAKALDGLELPLGIIGVLGTFAVRNVK
jgi:hypothetical protein